MIFINRCVSFSQLSLDEVVEVMIFDNFSSHFNEGG